MNRWTGAGTVLEDSAFTWLYYGAGVARFVLVIDTSYQDGRGRLIKRAHHQPVRVFGKRGEELNPLLKAGKRVRIDGPLMMNRYPDGTSLLECNADRVIFL